MKLARWVALAALMLMTSAALAGTISPQLQAEIDRTAPNLPISVIVNLSNQAPIALLNQDMNARHATMQERHMRVVTALQAAAAQSQGPVKQMLDEGMLRGDVLGYTCYWISNMIVAQMKHDAIYRLAARSDVDVVEPNFRPQLIEPVAITPGMDNEETGDTRDITPAGIRAIRAPDCWYHLGINGTGRLIGGMDTGVMGTHPALQTRWRGYNGAHPWQECWLDVLGNGTTSPVDNYGHGTHTMGTMTGLAPAESVGVAPGAKWISCNAIDQGVGSEFDNDVIHGFQWFADPDGNPNTVDDVPDVVQNSWGINEGFGGGYTDCDVRWWNVLDNLNAAGVVVTWSAGNEGPGAQTLRSPADRAATVYEAFSVGAVDATNGSWPYPIASFSSRGPTGCNVPVNQKTKPEVAAPGVQVWSAYNNGSYTYMDGTSMAGPHVAGTVALIRQANPNLTPDEVKQILMTTARDEGTAGEDNTYGWGFIDAYAAVQAAMVGLGHITGHVTNASWLNGPIQDAVVRVLGQSISWSSDPTGLYGGPIAAGTYLIEASKAGFRADTAAVVIHQNQITTHDFALRDNAGPAITGVTNNVSTNDSIGPYVIQATATDPSTVTSVKLYYGMNGGGMSSIDMTPAGGNSYSASLPGIPPGNRYDYYVWAMDGVNNASTSPTYHLYITHQVYAYDCETTPTGWQMGIGGDTAVSGVWICADPVGTTYGTPPWQVQPEDDHTPNPGTICFVTGNGDVGGAAGQADVDGGCTTLISPTYSLGSATMAFFTYWRWYAIGGNSADDTFAVDISGDGGATWVPWERVSDNENTWTKVTKSVADVLNPLPATITFRFIACDNGAAGLVEAAIDDLSMDVFGQNPAGAPNGIVPLRTELAQNTPNPFNPKTTIRFTLSGRAQTRLEIYDAAGRMIRVLLDGTRPAGAQQIVWDGLDDAGRQVGSGVYFYRLKAGSFEQARRMTILK